MPQTSYLFTKGLCIALLLTLLLATLLCLSVCLLTPVEVGTTAIMRAASAELARGLVLQEGDPDKAAAVGVGLVAKRYPASRCRWEGEQLACPALDADLARAAELGVKVVPGLMFANVTAGGAPSAMPVGWPAVCWQGASPGCGPTWQSAWTRSELRRWVQGWARRYDGNPQIAAFMVNLGLDGERRFCKYPLEAGPAGCRAVYVAAGLTSENWRVHVGDLERAYRDAFTLTDLFLHYSGFGFASWEIGRDAGLGVGYGMGLMSSGLYPGQCRGDSYGGQCTPLEPLNTDWLAFAKWPSAFAAMEQSLAYTGDEAALAWLWAVSHGAGQIHAQQGTLQNLASTEMWETATYYLAHPDAALWVARDLDSVRCKAWYGEYGDYCGERGNWSRNVISTTATTAVAYNVTTTYMGWVARRGPVTLRTNVQGPALVRVVRPNGKVEEWWQENGAVVEVPSDQYVHRVEVRPAASPPPTPTPTPTPTSTSTPTPTPTRTATPTPTPTWTPTPTPTASGCRSPFGDTQGAWRITGSIGEAPVDLCVQGVVQSGAEE